MPRIIEAEYTGGRLLEDTAGRLEITVYVDGVATNASAGTPTFTVTRADGTVLVSAQNATTAVTGVYYYDLTPANLSRVDRLTVALTGTWASVASQVFSFPVEVVGEHLFTVKEAREFDNADGSTGALNDATKYPVSAIVQARDEITDLLEEWTSVSWIPRHARYSLPGTGGRTLYTRHRKIRELIAASIGGTAQTVGNITIREIPGVLYHETSVWTVGTASDPNNVTVEYKHGFDGQPDGVKRIALLLLRERLAKTDIPANARSYSNQAGAYDFILPGGPMGNRTRIPEVNQWIEDHQYRTPLVGSL